MRRRCALALVLVTPLGFATKLYAGPGSVWVNHFAGGVLYVLFWVLGVLAVAPRLSPGRVAAAVLAATCGLELLQLWHPPLLEAVRATFLGRTLIGASFSLWDFPHYLLGAALGAWLTGRWALDTQSGP